MFVVLSKCPNQCQNNCNVRLTFENFFDEIFRKPHFFSHLYKKYLPPEIVSTLKIVLPWKIFTSLKIFFNLKKFFTL